ncbi:MAG: hypothetical protein R3E96_00400 [Planctomycetota bacterium]
MYAGIDKDEGEAFRPASSGFMDLYNNVVQMQSVRERPDLARIWTPQAATEAKTWAPAALPSCRPPRPPASAQLLADTGTPLFDTVQNSPLPGGGSHHRRHGFRGARGWPAATTSRP